ncbi:CaiB/BaiF CoA transferase family protein [Variovorax sp. Root411]|uniref:CaiB/BaiF CoA transferase family protein n=1 Tax=Variovorax sp. Root411 TaxID=1736530 RepID=UPI0006FADDE6|nr:CaiB/BaiF CoA-transferase family protein [Variovorax sp. Root411]KQW54286.1 carnitine dehydratase [Variovorax sp. Root411]
MTSGPLSDLTVVEFAGLGPAPYAAMLLADMGATVIRIERPDALPAPATAISQRGRAQRYTADLKKPGDVAFVRKLLRSADALIEGFRPGTMERLGLSPEVLLEDNPRLVYGRVTGWGQTGPLKTTAGHDVNFIAITGALAAIGPRERPVLPLNLIGDFAGGSMFLLSGMLAALLAARRTGKGQVVDAAMCDGVISLMTGIHEQLAEGKWAEVRESNVFDGGLPHYRIYECADGKHLSVGPLEEPFYVRLCEAVGMVPPPPRDEPSHWPALRATFEKIFKTRTRDEWTALLEQGDHCVSPVLSISEAPRHPHLAARSSFVNVDGVLQAAPVPRFSHDPTQARAGVREPLPIARAMASEVAG